MTGQDSNFLGACASGDPERDGGVPEVVDAKPILIEAGVVALVVLLSWLS